jgi:hypothetical protein
MMDKDDKKYIKQGYSLFDLQQHFTDNNIIILGEEVERERKKKT